MPTIATTPIPTPTISQDIELWLSELTQAERARPLLWTGDLGTGPAHTREQLSLLVSHVRAPLKLRNYVRYSFGLARWSDHDQRPRWAQTMRLRTGWIVEVSTGTADSWPLRVFRGGPGATYPEHSRDNSPDPNELWSPLAAAEIIWAWQHSGLPDGCQGTLAYLTDHQLRKYGV